MGSPGRRWGGFSESRPRRCSLLHGLLPVWFRRKAGCGWSDLAARVSGLPGTQGPAGGEVGVWRTPEQRWGGCRAEGRAAGGWGLRVMSHSVLCEAAAAASPIPGRSLSIPTFFCQDLPCDPSLWGPKLIQLLKNERLGPKGSGQAGRSWLSRPFCVPGIELCPPGKRFMITMVASFVTTAGQFLMPGLAALCRDWQVLQALIICPFLLMLLYWS